MTSSPVTVRPETPIEDITGLLIVHYINGVPAVDDAGRLPGTVTAEDPIHREADERFEPRESIRSRRHFPYRHPESPAGTRKPNAKRRLT